MAYLITLLQENHQTKNLKTPFVALHRGNIYMEERRPMERLGRTEIKYKCCPIEEESLH